MLPETAYLPKNRPVNVALTKLAALLESVQENWPDMVSPLAVAFIEYVQFALTGSGD